MDVTAAGAPSAYAPTGNVDTTAGFSLYLPAGVQVGDYLVASVFFAQATGAGGQGTPPTGWTILNPSQGTTNNRMLLLYGYPVKDAAALAALGSSVLFHSGASATRVVAFMQRFVGHDLTKSPTVSALEFSAAAATAVTFPAPSSGTTFFWLGTNSSAPTPNSVMSSVGGTKLAQAQAPAAASGSVADSQLGMFKGGSGATLSTSVPNHVSWGLGFTPLVVAPTGFPGIFRDSGGVNHHGTLFWWDGAMRVEVAYAKPVYPPATVSETIAPSALPWFPLHRGASYNYPEETMRGYRACAGQHAKILEVSVWLSSDGKFICSHDKDLARVTGTSLDITTSTAAAATALSARGATAAGNPSQPAQPIIELTTLLDEFAATHVIVIECKQGQPAKSALLDLMATYGTTARPATEIFIWKADALGNKPDFFDIAIARGYHRWAYIFDSDMAAQFATLVSSGKADMIGLDWHSSDATLAAAIAACRDAGIMPTGHIVSDVAQRDRLLSLGMDGMMLSNILALPY